MANFVLNCLSSILQHLTRAPNGEDIQNIHTMIDQVAEQYGISGDAGAGATIMSNTASPQSQSMQNASLPSQSMQNVSSSPSQSMQNVSSSSSQSMQNDISSSSRHMASSASQSMQNVSSSSQPMQTVSSSSKHIASSLSSSQSIQNGSSSTIQNVSSQPTQTEQPPQPMQNVSSLLASTSHPMPVKNEAIHPNPKQPASDTTQQQSNESGTVDSDEESFHSAKDDQSTSSNLSFIEDVEGIQWPDGDTTYKLKGTKDQMAWATYQCWHNPPSKKNVITSFKQCLGVYECREDGCMFRSRPKGPTSRKKNAKPKGPRQTHCSIHPSSQLVHMPCNASMAIQKHMDEDYIEIAHKGTHEHLRPLPIHVSEKGAKAFSEAVRRNPETKPKSLQVGSEARVSVTAHDPLYLNIDRVRAKRRAELEQLALVESDEIAKYDSTTKTDIITESSVRMEDGCIILQSNTMRKIMNDSKEASQTDTVEGFVMSHHLPSVNLTITSTYCHIQEKWVPTQFGILFGKSAKHYAIFFYTLLKNMNYDNFEDFINRFMGMCCDFSEAERVGFIDGVVKRFPTVDVEGCKYFIDKLYAFCDIHFDRSACRIRMNNTVVPQTRKAEFKDKVAMLKTESDLQQFNEHVAYLMREFPKCKPWLEWYLHPDRAKCIFRAAATHEFAGKCRNTNAEESMGRTIQLTCMYDNPSVKQIYFHLFKYIHLIDAEYAMAAANGPGSIKYGTQRKRVRREHSNDGRAPDTNQALFPTRARQNNTKIGRPKNSRNLAPTGNAIDISIAIPWGLKHSANSKFYYGYNTCAGDTCFTAMYYLRKYDDKLLLAFRDNDKLNDVLDLIHQGKYDLARYEWYVYLEESYGVTGEPASDGTVLKRTKVTDEREEWDCFGGIQVQVHRLNMFKFTYCNDYQWCEKDGDSGVNFSCPYFEEYGEGMYPNRLQTDRFIRVFTDQMHQMQETVFNKEYNTYGRKVNCGEGMKRTSKECNGEREVRRFIQVPPKLLMIDRMRREWDLSSGSTRRTKLTSIDKIEHQLMINEQRYVLVQINVGNGVHWNGITLILGKYLLFDGCKETRLRWVPETFEFKTLGSYDVENLWYRPCDSEEEEEEARVDEADGDGSGSNVATSGLGDSGVVDEANDATNDATENLSDAKQQSSSDSARVADTSQNNDPAPKKNRKRKKGDNEAANNATENLSGAMQQSEPGIAGVSVSQKKDPPKKKKKKRQKSHPMGVSISSVSAKGKQPICKYCLQKIQRGQWHAVKKEKNQEDNKWKSTHHYHFECSRAVFHDNERRQLVAIVSSSEDIDEDLKAIMISDIGTV